MNSLRRILTVSGTWLKIGWQLAGLTLIYFVVLNVVAKLALMAAGEQPVDMEYRTSELIDAYGNAPWIKDYVDGESRPPSAVAFLCLFHAKPSADEIHKYRWSRAKSDLEPEAQPSLVPGTGHFVFSCLAGPRCGVLGHAMTTPYRRCSALVVARRGISGVEVTNFGQIGYVSTQEALLLFEQLRKGNVPDFAVFYDGVNDTFAAWQSGTAGIPNDEYNREREFGLLDDWEGYDSDRLESFYRYARYEMPVLVLQSPLGKGPEEGR